MSSISGTTLITARAAGTRSADEAAVGASDRAVAQPSAGDLEPPRGSTNRHHVPRPGAAGTERQSAPAEQNSRQVEVAEHGEVVAVADVEPTDDQGVVRASLHARAGHLPTGARTRLSRRPRTATGWRQRSRSVTTLGVEAQAPCDANDS